MAQVKLSAAEQEELFDLMDYVKDNEGTIYHNTRTGVTVVKLPEFPGSRMAKFSVSMRSGVESQNNRKYGLYTALQNLTYGEYVKMPNYITAQEFAEFVSE